MTCVVIGSGPSGTQTALTLLKRGKRVELWDVGRKESPFPNPEATFHELKSVLQDPQEYFLGRNFETLLPPDAGELFRYPSARSFLLEESDTAWPFATGLFRPFISLAQGGLAAGWGANALSYDEDDLQDWPIHFSDLSDAYAETFRRIAVAGPQEDDLSSFFPGLRITQPAVHLSLHDQTLLKTYQNRRGRFQKKWGLHLGQARLAVVNDSHSTNACRYCGRCLWGCPYSALYNPAQVTLMECQKYPHFSYKGDRLVLSMEVSQGKVTGVRYRDMLAGEERVEPCERVFLAAGALQSGAIFLRSLKNDERVLSGQIRGTRTHSVMDTRVIKIPYLQLRSVGNGEESNQFQLNRLILAHRKSWDGAWPSHIHGEVLSLNTLLYHPLVESIPLGSRASLKLFFHLKPALGVISLFFPDKQWKDNGLSLETAPDSLTGDRVRVHYQEPDKKEEYIRNVVQDVRSAFVRMGCIPWGGLKGRPGAGIHYAGTIPMGEGPLCVDTRGRSHAFENLYVADGAAFPSLPSKSITTTLMAHAIRVATLAQV
ncbi:MAG: GMC family oxidoreductase [Elusimicrobia bacterium]|nr:GMC family oxidoreductase [Elusimicrobiota bacterium]